jgi:sortase B
MSSLARQAVRAGNGAVNLTLTLIVTAMLGLGCYGVWDSAQITQGASAELYASYKPADHGTPLSFHDLQVINPDVIAWLTVYGTHIDYPMAQGDNNLVYTNTDAMGAYSLSGAIFLDSANQADFSDFNSIVYGHNMDKNTMFADIAAFADEDFFAERRYGTLYHDGLTEGLEFFAFVEADGYDTSVFRTAVTGMDERQAYLKRLESLAVHTRPDVTVTDTDRIVLLSTCSTASTNGRDILVAKITDRVETDPFPSAPTSSLAVPAVDQLIGVWARTPEWAKIAWPIVAASAVLCAIVVTLVRRRRRPTLIRRCVPARRGAIT